MPEPDRDVEAEAVDEASEWARAELEETAETLLSRMLPPRTIVAALVRQHGGITRGQAAGAVRRVRERWSEEEPTVDRLVRRRQLRAAVEELYRDARLRKRQEIVQHQDGSTEMRETIDPDRTFCLRCLEFLARLDGLISGDAIGGGARAAHIVDEDAVEIRARLEGWLETLPPARREEIVGALLDAEEAARGSVAAFVLASKAIGGNGHSGNGNGQHKAEEAGE